MCLVVWLSVSDDGNDNNEQCTMYSSVCFKDSIWHECRVTHPEMHENHRVREDGKRLLHLMQFWECRPPGWYGGKCRSAFVPSVCGSISDDLTEWLFL